MEGSVMKCVGGTRQEGGWQDHTPSSRPFLGTILSDIHSVWTDDVGTQYTQAGIMTFGYNHLPVAHGIVFKRLVGFVGYLFFIYFLVLPYFVLF